MHSNLGKLICKKLGYPRGGYHLHVVTHYPEIAWALSSITESDMLKLQEKLKFHEKLGK